jgi:hypothetical protein
MGFIRRQEEKFAARLLAWQYQRLNRPVPAAVDLDREAVRIVDEAHRIARERGSNVMAIVREMIADVRKGK